MDLPPVAGPVEAAIWKIVRNIYSALSRASDWNAVGPAARAILKNVTEITPLQNRSTRQPASVMTRIADWMASSFGGRLRKLASESEITVIATYPAAALAFNRMKSARVFCLATDTDLNRAWAPSNAEAGTIEYFAPVERVVRRLRSFGVSDSKIHLTGFPLPAKLVRQAPDDLARRLTCLDPRGAFKKNAPEEAVAMINSSPCPSGERPISLTIAIGGAGAQTRQVGRLLMALKEWIVNGKLKFNMIAGIRPDVVDVLHKMVLSAGLSTFLKDRIDVLFEDNFKDYFHRFNDCLADTDVLWTKPSELAFYAALGLPILLTDPVGDQEKANRNWLLSQDSALDAGDPDFFSLRLKEMLGAGELCRIAWNAYTNLDRNGIERIYRHILNSSDLDSNSSAQFDWLLSS
jgi:hypothetical protein